MRKATEKDFYYGNRLHYWGRVRMVLFVNPDEIALKVPEFIGGKVMVKKDNPFLLSYDPPSEEDAIDDIYG